ncbi:MAG: alpha/beta hydrolase [Flavobacteriaceae bacterium]|nr:alpha/beta hydrolase [Flavobacteriaceae bacterium]
MKTLQRIFIWSSLVGIVLLLLFLWGSNSMEKRDDFSSLATLFEQNNLSIEEHLYRVEGGELYAVQIGDKSLPTLLLIHGSPGDWTAWKELILSTDLTDRYQLIIPDRPGYQYSTVKGGSLSTQSTSMAILMQKHCDPCSVVGHSFGGALALQLAVYYPEKVTAVVSLSGTIAAPFQTPQWYNYWGSNQWIQQLLSNSFLVSNREMMSLSKDLLAIESKLKELDQPILLLQGGKDVLVNPASPFYLLNQLNQVHLKYYDTWNHFIIWTQMEEVAQFLLSF